MSLSYSWPCMCIIDARATKRKKVCFLTQTK